MDGDHRLTPHFIQMRNVPRYIANTFQATKVAFLNAYGYE
jgi:UDP-glucose 6-dehydrogenase